MARPGARGVSWRLVLGALDEETAFVECDVGCDADIILGHDWLHAHGLTFLYDADEVCFCAELGYTSGRRVRLDLTLAAPTSPATRLSATEAQALLGLVSLGAAPTLGRPSQWIPPSGCPAALRCPRGRRLG
jgi:hypothetical protein